MTQETIHHSATFGVEPDEPCDMPGCTQTHTQLIVYVTTGRQILISLRCDEHFEVLPIGSPIHDEEEPCPS